MKQDLSDYGPGAALATALVNSSARVRAAGETLAGPERLRAFLGEHGVESGAGPTASDVRAVHALRDEVRDLLEEPDVERAVARANALLARAGATPGLGTDPDGRRQWYATAAPGASLADRIAMVVGIGVLGVLRALGPHRVRSCADPTCEGMFVDASKAGRRRYCTPELCGNRVNVARYRERHGR